MNTQSLINELLAQSELTAQKQLLAQRFDELDEASLDTLAEGLKGAFDNLLRRDLNGSQQILDLLYCLAQETRNPFHQALALRARGNFHMIGRGEPEEAIGCYDQAAAIYRAHGRTLDEAGALVGKVGGLAHIGRSDEAMLVYESAAKILSAHERWLQLAGMSLNLTIAYGRLGDESRALEIADRAGELYRKADPAGKPFIPWVENNRAICLCNLGKFEESIQASQRAVDLSTELGQSASAAVAQQTMAFTYFVLGRYNEALDIFHKVRDVLVTDNRLHDASVVDLDSSDLLLQLGRFSEVLEKCRQIRKLFVGPAKHIEITRAILNEGLAYAGLRRYKDALSSFAETRRYFEEQGSEIWMAITDLATANVLYSQKKFESCLATARACADLFRTHDLTVKQAKANLLTARAAGALQQHELALQLATEALQIGQRNDIPLITYQCHHLLGQLAAGKGDWQKAMRAYQQAIQELERQRGQIMVEYRAGFLADKQAVYEDMVKLCLDLGHNKRAFEYAERAKSRALLDLLTYRLDVSLTPRSENDAPLVQEITSLRAERDRLYRRWESRRVWEESRDMPEDEWSQIQQAIVAQEKEITEKWHALLVRNADYARDASLWQVRNEEVQPYLTQETLLVEYFMIGDQLIAFLVTSDSVQVRRLPAKLTQIKRYWNMLRMNLATVPKSKPQQIAYLADSVRASSLRPLYQLLIAPLADLLANYEQLIIVPHDLLHYLPFHAFHDGQQYLLEQHAVSYLPSASVLGYARQVESTAQRVVAFGYSDHGHLPGRVQESRSIAQTMGGQAFVEEQTTLAQVRASANDCRILHLATHGYFHQNNSLFSGLMLADGYLTTLEIFNLRLNASLVTLSGCQTGQSTIGGGDELQGLMRAFLYAGAASLVLTHWAVEDQSTALLMHLFYQKLAAGSTKGAALRHAQLQLMHSNREAAPQMKEMYAHPYFWASCFMVGDTGEL
ncbi:MAG: CHAT domain-containing protein [Ardenticatenaceae bacterium]